MKYWEIWNEPDDAQYWREQDGMKSYVELLKQVYPAIKDVDPTSVVLMGGVSRSIPLSMSQIYEHGGKNFFDIVNMHPFLNPGDPEGIKKLKGIYQAVKKQMRMNQDMHKPIWITEIGCPGTRGGNQSTAWWLGSTPNESEQARWVQQVYQSLLQLEGVDKVFWAFFRDTSNYFKNDIDHFGLVRNDFTKKPAYSAYQKLSRLNR